MSGYSTYDQFYSSSSEQSYNNYTIRPVYPSSTTDPYYNSRRSSQSYNHTTSSTSPNSSYNYSPGSSPQFSISTSSSTSPSTASNTSSPIYYCLFSNCTHYCARKADLERHVQVTHLRDTLDLVDCQHYECHRKGRYGFTRKDKMIDHMRDVHKVDIPKRSRTNGGRR